MCTIPRLAAFCLVTLLAALGADAASTGNEFMGLADLRIEDVNLHSAYVVPAAGDLPELTTPTMRTSAPSPLGAAN